MNSDLKSALDFAIGYGSVENLIELVICGVILAIKFH